MKGKEIREYLKKEWSLMRSHLDGFLNTRDQEELHKFRVEIKKIKALLTLSENVSRTSFTNAFKPINALFKKAGKVRSDYIKNTLTKKDQHDDKEIRSFCRLSVKREKHIRCAYRELHSNIRRFSNKKIRRFYKEEMLSVAKKLADRPSAEQLHECRKRIKVLLYNYALIHNALLFNLNTAYIDSLQEAIGTWHDQYLAGKITGDMPLSMNSLAGNFYERAIQHVDQHQVPI
ncbi:CHAD domain-containing protein [Mucilaginibacter sp. L3T2-6]|uniref:CHAD domain-containing protein n=1 Tax=Mucilaginibacter sp. L3T2-6 TaxID=3062491 RepID=UPI002676C761|nr:CHAD domain-containing protein [Mucilaginibacter sp. L3T2-6]MDO3643653.1 CHAD domain-containing protein [Mucilaginibacter sp. L3T2-6]MDV6216099.1 CHAD domain-containing protein [Mucilaginibacter sp. L3T2-6]